MKRNFIGILAIFIYVSLALDGFAQPRDIHRIRRRKGIRREVVRPADDRELFGRIEECFLGERYQQAVTLCRELINSLPRSRYADDGLYIMGLAYLKEEEFVLARRSFESILSQYPDSDLRDDAEIGLADSYYLEEDIDKATALLREIPTRYPESASLCRVYFKLGECYQKKGIWGQARYYFQKVQADYPLSFEASRVAEILKEGKLCFTVQVGSFVDKDNAREVCDRLQRRGYTTHISEVRRGGRLFYRVRVGEFDTKVEAEYMAKDLRKEGFPTKICP